MLIFVFPRYGLPVNFQTVLVQPSKKTIKKLREVLQQLYAHLDTGGLMSDKQSSEVTVFICFSTYF